MYKEQEHSYKLLNRVIKSEDFPSVMLIYGRERLLIDWAIRSIKRAVINPATESLDFTVPDDDCSASDVIAACETLPMFSQKKLVLVKDIIPASETADQFDSKIAEYISDMPQSTLLLIVRDNIDKRKQLYKKIIQTGLAFDFTPLDIPTLYGWAKKRCQNLEKETLVQFANEAGYFDTKRNYTLYNLDGDLKKAAALYSDKEKINLDDLLFISNAGAELDAFKLLDAAFSNKKSDAFKLLDNLIKAEKPSAWQAVIFQFQGLMCSQLEIMLEARQRIECGASLSDMKVNEYRLKKAIASSERLSTARLKAALAGAYKIESDIKSGRINARLSMELFLAKI